MVRPVVCVQYLWGHVLCWQNRSSGVLDLLEGDECPIFSDCFLLRIAGHVGTTQSISVAFLDTDEPMYLKSKLLCSLLSPSENQVGFSWNKVNNKWNTEYLGLKSWDLKRKLLWSWTSGVLGMDGWSPIIMGFDHLWLSETWRSVAPARGRPALFCLLPADPEHTWKHGECGTWACGTQWLWM